MVVNNTTPTAMFTHSGNMEKFLGSNVFQDTTPSLQSQKIMKNMIVDI